MPGADYVWHEISFTLAPDTDYHTAEQRLLGAVESVFKLQAISIGHLRLDPRSFESGGDGARQNRE